MRDIFSHYVSMVCMILTFIICFMFTFVNIEVSYAKSYHTAVVEQVSDTNLSEGAIKRLSNDVIGASLASDGEKAEYRNLVAKGTGASGFSRDRLSSAEKERYDKLNARMWNIDVDRNLDARTTDSGGARVTLTYHIPVPIFNQMITGTLVGYAY